jgi:predicted ATP-grasp superfamily ATP-dependent carboligase
MTQDATRAPGVVVTGIDTASSTAAVRSLGRRGLRPIVATEHRRPPAATSRYCAEVVPLPDPNEDIDAYERTLLPLLERDDVATMLPFREVDVYTLARNRDRLADEIGRPWPDLETLGGAQDRKRLFAAADRAGVATPRTRPVDEWDAWDDRTIVKPRFTVRAPEYEERFATAETQHSSTRYVPPGERVDPVSLVAEMDHVPLAQSFVPTTDEYGFFALYDHGEAVATFQHRQRRGWSYAGGPSAFRESVAIPALESAGRALLDELEWHGVAMVEFLRDPRTGEFKLMEVNPRFWSSLPFTVQAGVDFPALAVSLATDLAVDHDGSYREGIAGHLLRGEGLHLASILREDNPLVERPSFIGRTGEIAASLVRHPRFDYLSTDDPRPFVRDLVNAVGSIGDKSGTDREEPDDIDDAGENEEVTNATERPLADH